MPNIAIVWDFDKTLTPEDSTSKVIKIMGYEGGESAFWDNIEFLTSNKKDEWEHVFVGFLTKDREQPTLPRPFISSNAHRKSLIQEGRGA